MNVLAVGAHFDDLEIGCGGTLAKHVRAGDRVIMAVITDSAFSTPDGTVIRRADTALREGKKAAEIIRAELLCLNYKTFNVPFDDGLAIKLITIIEENEIDTVYSHWASDIHRDHQAAGRSVLMAGRHVPRFLMYRSNYYDADRQFVGNFYSDISGVIDIKVEAIKAHESEMKRINYTWLDFILKQNANDGQKINVDYAECFEVVRYLI
ncbi:MAG: PIG-L deacetylase family protein [Thermodesulfobacteriota bacterium]|nr:PIG-L deacetylase family protein [Thermodesulfobacteriota bacterium]